MERRVRKITAAGMRLTKQTPHASVGWIGMDRQWTFGNWMYKRELIGM